MADQQIPGVAARKAWMGLLARAPADRLMALWNGASLSPDCKILRAPEIGGVMVRGRMGGTGAPFNLGEMTVTRCSLSLPDGTVGHGYVQGRSKPAAEIAAKLDALMQTDQAGTIRDAILTPLQRSEDEKRKQRAAKAAATKVEFFTMARGED
jgi:alpha-D-ribose 1-methylphosphonate 5-triphosphate synthase subunit PhnG